MGVRLSKSVWLSDWLNDRFRFRPFRRNQFQLAWKKALHYMEFPAGGESIKSVGKALHYARKGYDGIIHLMPFTCMPELVAQTVIARISHDYHLPVLTLIYDEHTSSTGLQTRLEAFIDLLAHHRYGSLSANGSDASLVWVGTLMGDKAAGVLAKGLSKATPVLHSSAGHTSSSWIDQ